MIGLDAAEISLVRSWKSELPALRSLLDTGRLFPLRSSAEYTSASVWPTFYTGTMPGEHGISHHLQWDPERMRLRRLSPEWFSCEPFWCDLARDGRDVVVLDVPFTFPSRLERGVELLNWGSHDLMGRFTGTPSHLAREVQRRFGSHPMGYEIPVAKSGSQVDRMRRRILTGARTKASLSRWLMETFDWDLFLTVFGECHRGGHVLWGDAGDAVPDAALLEVYREVDRSVALLLEGIDLDSTTVVLFSLHGMGPNRSQEHFVRPVMDRINVRFTNRSLASEARAAATPTWKQNGLVRRLRESIPAGLQLAAARAVPVGVRDWIVDREATGGIDWASTPGIALRSDLHSFIRLNVAGRERDGILVEGSDEHRRYLDRVRRCFLELRAGETGEPVARDVLIADEVLPGRRRHLMPDLIVRWGEHPPLTRIGSPELGDFVGSLGSGRGGEHQLEGFAIVTGRAARQGGLPPLGHNADFAGFVRHLTARSASARRVSA